MEEKIPEFRIQKNTLTTEKQINIIEKEESSSEETESMELDETTMEYTNHEEEQEESQPHHHLEQKQQPHHQQQSSISLDLRPPPYPPIHMLPIIEIQKINKEDEKMKINDVHMMKNQILPPPPSYDLPYPPSKPSKPSPIVRRFSKENHLSPQDHQFLPPPPSPRTRKKLEHNKKKKIKQQQQYNHFHFQQLPKDQQTQQRSLSKNKKLPPFSSIKLRKRNSFHKKSSEEQKQEQSALSFHPLFQRQQSRHGSEKNGHQTSSRSANSSTNTLQNLARLHSTKNYGKLKHTHTHKINY